MIILQLAAAVAATPFIITLPAAYALWVFCHRLLWRLATDPRPSNPVKTFLAGSAVVYLACTEYYKDVVLFCAAKFGGWAVDVLCTAACTFIAVAWWTQGQRRSHLLDLVVTQWRFTTFAAWMALVGVKVECKGAEGEWRVHFSMALWG
jgi:hypothetical protein